MSATNNRTADDDDRGFTITARDLLQANATIIAGVLIFLSLTLSFAEEFGRPLEPVMLFTIGLGTIPFVVSCDLLLTRWNNSAHGFRVARAVTSIGLLYLTGTIVLFLGLSQGLFDNDNDDNNNTTNTTAATTNNNTTITPTTTNTNNAADTITPVTNGTASESTTNSNGGIITVRNSTDSNNTINPN